MDELKYTLYPGQWIQIGEVKIKLFEITRGPRARLVIDAPKQVRVQRAETISKRDCTNGEDRLE